MKTPRSTRRLALLVAAVLPATAALAADWQRQPRTLLAFAAAADDARLAHQRAVFAALGNEAVERELVLVEVAGTTVTPPTAGDADALRARHGVDAGQFRVLLLGKDGGVKLESAAPVERCVLLGLIDAMPMRQREIGAAGGRPGC
jgi:hypothetical protein